MDVALGKKYKKQRLGNVVDANQVLKGVVISI